jgi:hypothetical protein
MKREQELIAALNRMLPDLGYRIIASEVRDGIDSGRLGANASNGGRP